MKRLLNTLYILSEDSYLALENENIVVLGEEGKRGQFPLLGLESIVSFSYKGASPALMGACARGGVGLVFLSPQGRFLARSCGRLEGNVLLRKRQYRLSEDEAASCLVARCCIFGKLYNSRWCLERTIRDHALRVDTEALKRSSSFLAATAAQALETTELAVLRGLEGQGATEYFRVFNEMLLQQKQDFSFTTRTRRPPLDRVNALLSFGYRLLANDCATALESVGLDPYVGFLHRDRPGRESLALDLMEELRSVFVDRLALTLINTKAIQPQHFEVQPGGAVLLNDKGRKIFLNAWQTKKREELTHPYLKEKVAWGLVPYVQALLLARFLRGDLDAYPAFLWK